MRMAGIYTANVNEPATRPIQPYERRPVVLRPWDPRVVEVAALVAILIESHRPDLRVEHIGSTAVPGLVGKGIVDLATEADPADIPAITSTVYELGFGPQPGPDPWPSTRPMHVGAYWLDGEEFRVHLHVHPTGGDLASDVRFRDALRADPTLAADYASVKQAIEDQAAGKGPLEGVVYQDAKGGWISAAYDRLGIRRSAAPGADRTEVAE
jgi:dephospho-CoA kinase